MVYDKYILKRVLLVALLFLTVFYGLYILVDYTSHLSNKSYTHFFLKPLEVLLHYGAEFSLRASILVPFALLIGTIFTLSQMNIKSELVALLAAGFSKSRILKPLLLLSIFVTFCLYINNEFFLPPSAEIINNLSSKYNSASLQKIRDETRAQKITLTNDEIIIYQNVNKKTKVFTNAFLIKSIDSIFHIESLDVSLSPPIGTFVDHYKRDLKGFLNLEASYTSYPFKDLELDQKLLSKTLASFDEMSMTDLSKELLNDGGLLDDEEITDDISRRQTALYYKLTTPWLAFLAVLIPIPFCFTFSRNFSMFLTFAISIFSLFAIYLLLNALLVLGERQVITPLAATVYPMSAIILLFLYRYLKVR